MDRLFEVQIYLYLTIVALCFVQSYVYSDGKEPGCLTIKCKNGGTMSTETCGCTCPAKYTGHLCEKELQPSTWPPGQYALPASMFGCPETDLHGWTLSFVNLSLPTTSTEQKWHDNDPLTFEPHILGPFYKRNFQFNFCNKEIHIEHKENFDVWDPGTYCIYRVNNCPNHFQEGNITIIGYSLINRAGDQLTAELSDNSSVIIHFCCRDDGDESVDIRLPNTFPFQLFKGYSARKCQKVEGMDVKEDTFFMVNEHKNWEFYPPHPEINTTYDKHTGIPFCYYYPSKPIECYYVMDYGYSYNGKTNMTKSGKPCLHWTSVSSEYINTRYWTGDFTNNFCRRDRNTNGFNSPYCFFNSTEPPELCEIPTCALDQPGIVEVHVNRPVYSVPYSRGGLPQFGIDGLIDSNSYVSARPILKPWYQIDLQEYHEVHAIVVNRYKLWFPMNLRAVGTYVSKQQWDFISNGAIRCDDIRYPRKASTFRFQCKRPLIGQFVTIRNFDFTDELQNPYFYLTFQEVRVLGKPTWCGRPLGMTTGDIRDFQMDSSTIMPEFLPELGTLYRIGNGWCSKTDDVQPWFMVDLIIPHIVQGVLVQGWTVNQETKFIKSFTVSYGMNLSKLEQYRELSDEIKVFEIEENRPPESSQRFLFWNDILTRYVKLLVVPHNKQACLKLEIIGCPKRGVRDFWCRNGSIDLGYEEQNFHDFWMEEPVPSPYMNRNSLSMVDCREYCLNRSCITFSFNPDDTTCFIHDGHRYNKHFKKWWVRLDKGAVVASQRLCYKDFRSLTECGGQIYLHGKDSVEIKSPGYPLHYGQGINCSWHIRTDIKKSVRIDLIDIQIPAAVSNVVLKENRFYELNPGYCKDKITIQISNTEKLVITSDNRESYTGSMIISQGNDVLIRLESCFHYTMIENQYFFIKVSQEDFPGCGMGSAGCRETCTQSSALISSPRYPAIYDENEFCYWEINGQFGQFVSFEFIDIDIPERDATCTQSFVALYDVSLNDKTKLLDRYCYHNRRHEPVITSWHKMKIEFRSEFLNEKGSGFLGRYTLVNFTQSYDNIINEDCGSGWYHFEGSCYKIFTSSISLTWMQAKQRCQNENSHLLSIGKKEEMEFIHFLMTNIWKDIPNNEAYIGLMKQSEKDRVQDYVWSDGKPLSFTAWFKDPNTLTPQPDGHQNEKCTLMRLYSIHTMDDWHDVACAYDKIHNYICEKTAFKMQGAANVSDLINGVKVPPDVKYILKFGMYNIFICDNLEVEPTIARCDGIAQCADGSDERYCYPPINCRDEARFECASKKQCIPLSLHCNFIVDCDDGSDEIDCVHPPCNLRHQWGCSSGQCIPIEQRCDLKYDCFDKSDEKDCETCNNFQCYDTSCISNTRICDGQIDCNGKLLEDEDQDCTSNVQTSCSAWWVLGARTSGEYLVSFGLNVSSIVECIFTTFEGGIKIKTVIHHNQEDAKFAKHSTIDINIDYTVTESQLRKIKTFSTCSQEIELECHFTENNFWWKDFNGHTHYLKGSSNCSCPFVQICTPGKTSCNCAKEVRDWYTYDQNHILVDKGIIMDQYRLPVMQVYTGNPLDEFRYMKFTLGPLVCEEDLTEITSDSLLCRSGITVSSKNLCLLDFDEYDEIKGCRDMSHLDNCVDFQCPAGYAKCNNSYCIPLRFVCDDVKHCKDGEDEEGCCKDCFKSSMSVAIPCPGSYRCYRSIICISLDQICDGIPQCPEADDEHMCYQSCPSICRCQDLEYKCTPSNNNTDNLLNRISSNVRSLDFSNSDFLLSNTSFNKFRLLIELNISNCNIETIPAKSFELLNNLLFLDLSHNKLSHLLSYTFEGLQNLQKILLHGNPLKKIEYYAFVGLLKLPVLEIHDSDIVSLEDNYFTGLASLQILNISKNKINFIKDNTFSNLEKLEKLDIQRNKIRSFSRDIFKGLVSLEHLFADEYVFCCLKPMSVRPENCLPPPDEFSSCADLMRIDLLRWSLWIIGLCAFLGNLFVLIYRLVVDRQMSLKSHGLLICNLSLSDLFMGLYLLIIAGSDANYRGRYIWNDYAWRNSQLCEMAGILSTVSSEASVMFISLITIDRFIAVKFPFGQVKFTVLHAKITSIVVWILVLFFGILPALPITYFEGFYSRSAVCLALPLTRDKPSGWEFSTAIFIFVNFALFSLIAIGQLMIYREVLLAGKNIKSQRRSQDLSVARSLFVVVFTDFLCWFPIGVMGLMSLSGRVVISGEVYAWAAVFILPINSALNPFLYTFSAILKQRRSFASTNSTRARSVLGKASNTSFVDICKNHQFILGSHDTLKQCLKDYVKIENLSVREMYVIIARCTKQMEFLHQREVCLGCLSQENVFPHLQNEVISDVFIQFTPKLAIEHNDLPTDLLELGNLTKQLLRVFQSKNGKTKDATDLKLK